VLKLHLTAVFQAINSKKTAITLGWAIKTHRTTLADSYLCNKKTLGAMLKPRSPEVQGSVATTNDVTLGGMSTTIILALVNLVSHRPAWIGICQCATLQSKARPIPFMRMNLQDWRQLYPFVDGKATTASKCKSLVARSQIGLRCDF
jgi:hypothetical protein